jgi:hypothetical protein
LKKVDLLEQNRKKMKNFSDFLQKKPAFSHTKIKAAYIK